MSIIKKTFGRGILLGFVLGIICIPSILLLGGVYLIKNPDGFVSQWAIGKAHSLMKGMNPIVAIKNYALQIRSSIASHTGTKSIYSFQKIEFSGSRAERSGALISWVSPFSDRVRLNEIPPQNKIQKSGHSRPINIIGLKGETLSFQIVLHSNDKMDNLMISLIANPLIKPGCIRIHRFREIYLKSMVYHKHSNSSLKKLMTPDPLIPFTDPYKPDHPLISQISLQENMNQPIWIDVHFSRQCQSGMFAGSLEIRESDTLLRKTSVNFNILNATLPQRVDLDRWMELYMGRFWHGENPKPGFEFETILHRYFVMAHRFGFATNSSGDIGPNIQWDWNTGKPVSVNWDDYDRIMGSELSGYLTGMTPNVWALPIGTYTLGTIGGFTYQTNSPSDIHDWKGIPDTATQEYAKLIVNHWKEKGWPLKRGFVYVWDEPDHQLYYPDIYRLIADIADSLHKGSNNQIRVMLTDTPYIWNRHQKGHDKKAMIGKINIWAPGDRVYIPDRMKEVQSGGNKTWFYQGGPPFLAATDLTGRGPGFRMWFWTAWKYHVNGVFNWASNMWNDNTKALNPYTNPGTGEGVVFYPGHQLHFLGIPDIDGPVPSIRMEQWRRGYEDYRYLVMLKRKGHETDADKMVNKLVNRGLDDGGYIPYWRNPLWQMPGDWNHDPKAWHQARLTLAKEIVQLYGKQ